MHPSSFQSLQLSPAIQRAIRDAGYDQPTPIQQSAIPHVLAGCDLLASAQTGTGKTAAFSLPLLHRLQEGGHTGRKGIRALILTPTRELALQIEENILTYSRHLPIRTAVLLGGVSQVPQVKALRRRPDILVATPGRLLDLIEQRHVYLDQVETLVLDEADRMLDMGFIHDVRRIVSHVPAKRQTLLFSATLSGDVGRFAADMLRDPVTVSVAPPSSVAANIEQKVLFTDRGDKRAVLTELLRDGSLDRVLVFTRTKHRADRLARQLSTAGIRADAIHSDKSQNARQRALAAFDRGHVTVLVGTDIVARGIDVEGISHVINYELPNDPSSYVHRIGRTARAGAAGTALSLCDADEVALLKDIEKLTGVPLVHHTGHRHHAPDIAARHTSSASPSASGGGGRKRGPRRRFSAPGERRAQSGRDGGFAPVRRKRS